MNKIQPNVTLAAQASGMGSVECFAARTMSTQAALAPSAKIAITGSVCGIKPGRLASNH